MREGGNEREKLARGWPHAFRHEAAVKTCYLYSVTSRLVNVRLDAERLRKARTLRERGVALSHLVREAIDERFDKLSEAAKPRDVKAIMARVFEQYPDPPDLPPRAYNVHNRKEVRHAILRKLRRRRR